ncbi:MAG: tetratricopeptide repeat protein [Nitrospirae bacterium]|nr:tetratricopeptide repeat protein [Nitrospirota bacterium]
MMPTANLWQAPGQQEQKTPVVSVLRVEDAVTNLEQQKDPKSLGQDVSHWGFLMLVPLRHDTNQYRADRHRAEVIQDGVTAGLSKMGLSAMARTETGLDQVRSLPEGHLVLHAKLRSFAVTNDLSLIIVLIANAGHLDKIKANVVMDCQLFQPGQATPLWQGTIEGKAELAMHEYSDVEIAQNVRWNQERSTVVRDAIEDAVGNLIAKSGIRQLSAKLQGEAQTRMLAKVQERETSGDLQGTLLLYMQAYRSAMGLEQTSSTLAGIARVLRKMPSKPALPEEARKFGVQATSLVERKRYEEAVALYKKALEIAPWWAEGHFNRALVLANQNRFHEAIAGMKHFVLLTPDSADARAAQDKLYEWELETNSHGTVGSDQRSQVPGSTEETMRQTGDALNTLGESVGQSRSVFGATTGSLKK